MKPTENDATMPRRGSRGQPRCRRVAACIQGLTRTGRDSIRRAIGMILSPRRLPSQRSARLGSKGSITCPEFAASGLLLLSKHLNAAGSLLPNCTRMVRLVAVSGDRARGASRQGPLHEKTSRRAVNGPVRSKAMASAPSLPAYGCWMLSYLPTKVVVVSLPRASTVITVPFSP